MNCRFGQVLALRILFGSVTGLRDWPSPLATSCRSFAKGFAIFGALYAFNECVIEKYRAKHDRVNPALAGCATGAMMAYGGGCGYGLMGGCNCLRAMS
jgi:mitochondrial import inner membrane translocase subunit TIM22